MMLPLVAPTAFRRPISRVRSATATSMMLIIPIAPSASVTNPRCQETRSWRQRFFQSGRRCECCPIRRTRPGCDSRIHDCADDFVDLDSRLFMRLARSGLIVDEGNRIDSVLHFGGREVRCIVVNGTKMRRFRCCYLRGRSASACRSPGIGRHSKGWCCLPKAGPGKAICGLHLPTPLPVVFSVIHGIEPAAVGHGKYRITLKLAGTPINCPLLVK